MLSSRHRFHGHGSLRFVYANGQVARSKYFICKSTSNKRRTQPRIAVVVSKKVMKPAVGRNRIRRRLYEAIRAELPDLVDQTDIVFIVISPEIMTASYDDIRNSLQGCLKQSHLYKNTEN